MDQTLVGLAVEKLHGLLQTGVGLGRVGGREGFAAGAKQGLERAGARAVDQPAFFILTHAFLGGQ